MLEYYDPWKKMKADNENQIMMELKETLNVNHWDLERKRGGKKGCWRYIHSHSSHICMYVYIYKYICV